MNVQMILNILGLVTIFEGIFLIFPCVTALIYQEKEGLAYLGTALLCFVIGKLLNLKKASSKSIYAKEGFAIVSLSWILLSIFGALPFAISGDIPSYVNALFEIISGITTTGASILSDVEQLSHTSLLWRSFSHWFGGMGVLMFVMAIMPMTKARNIHLMRAESPGPSVEKLVPKVKHTALFLYSAYLLLTIIQFVLLVLGGVSVFESINIAFATAGTGGFSVKNSGFADYSPYVQYVTSIFMILFGVNFNVYFLIILKRFKDALTFEELRHYLLIIAVAVLALTINIRHLFPTLEESFRHALFQLSSLMTTTGFASTDFDQWPSFSINILILIMFIGACAGSTGGGIKVSRIALLFKGVRRELIRTCHPNSVHTVKYNKSLISPELLRSIYAFIAVYVFIFSISQLLLSLNGYDFTTNFTAVAATLNNIGPGFSKVGPTCNFGFFSGFSKFVLMFDMLAGRLELFPMILLFNPRFWMNEKKIFHKR